jgi:hypothetical protein
MTGCYQMFKGISIKNVKVKKMLKRRGEKIKKKLSARSKVTTRRNRIK